MTRRRRKTRKLIVAKRKQGGFIIPGVLASIAALAGIANSVSNIRKSNQTFNELKRHNAVMESKGKGLYLNPYRKGKGLKKRKKKKRKNKN